LLTPKYADTISYSQVSDTKVDHLGHTVKPRKRRAKGPVNCTSCGAQFDKPCDLRTHMRDHDNRYKCSKCHKTFAEAGNLANHRAMHNDGPWKCEFEICGKIFRKASSFRIHEKIHDPDRKIHVCLVKGCGREYAQKVGLNRHVKLVRIRRAGERAPIC
jgi:uncharacterized Zn-finger protein